MTTALSVRTEIAALATLPTLSPSLSRLVYRLTEEDNPYRHHIKVAGRDATEAAARLSQVEHMCRPAPNALIAAWCRKLVPHLPKAPIDETGFNRSVEGFVLACGDLPYSVWTQQTVAEALKVLKWWPSPAQVREVLLPVASPIWKMYNGLETAVRLSDGTAQAPEPEAHTDDAKAHVSAITAAFVAERSFNDPNHAQHRGPAKAAPLSDGALLATWEKAQADGIPGASIRVQQLRERLGVYPD